MRTSTPELTAAIKAPVVYSIALVQLDFDSGSVCWNSGFSPISYVGKTFGAVGALSSISGVSESPGMKVSTASVTLSGIKPEIVALMLLEPYMGRKAFIYHAVVGEDMVFNPLTCKMIFSGKMDGVSGKQGASASFTVSIKSRLADWERSRNLQYSDVDQQKLYPGDRFMEYIPQISQMKIIWPRAAAQVDSRGTL